MIASDLQPFILPFVFALLAVVWNKLTVTGPVVQIGIN